MTERMLNALGVMTCADLYQKRAILHLLFSPVSMQSFLCICLGIGSAKVFRYVAALSIELDPCLNMLFLCCISVNMREKASVQKGIQLEKIKLH